MMDLITLIMVEVLSILGIATKEMKQGRLSKHLLYNIQYNNCLTKDCLEKYVKKLIGKTKLEDALKRLDKLTQEEARMASAQNLNIGHTVDERVRGVVDKVVAIDDRVANVNDRVVIVDEGVKMVDNKVTQVIVGA